MQPQHQHLTKSSSVAMASHASSLSSTMAFDSIGGSPFAHVARPPTLGEPEESEPQVGGNPPRAPYFPCRPWGNSQRVTHILGLPTRVSLRVHYFLPTRDPLNPFPEDWDYRPRSFALQEDG
jgi:hypothetical protein